MKKCVLICLLVTLTVFVSCSFFSEKESYYSGSVYILDRPLRKDDSIRFVRKKIYIEDGKVTKIEECSEFFVTLQEKD